MLTTKFINLLNDHLQLQKEIRDPDFCKQKRIKITISEMLHRSRFTIFTTKVPQKCNNCKNTGLVSVMLKMEQRSQMLPLWIFLLLNISFVILFVLHCTLCYIICLKNMGIFFASSTHFDLKSRAQDILCWKHLPKTTISHYLYPYWGWVPEWWIWWDVTVHGTPHLTFSTSPVSYHTF